MHAPWTVTFKPQKLSEVIGNQKAIQKLVKWIYSWDRTIPKKRAALLYGPPGVGKTLCVETLAKDLDLELFEENASDYRTADALQRFAGRASQHNTLFNKKRLVLLDEIDGLTGSADRGGVRAITEIVKSAQCPIVLIANDAYDPRFSTLRRYCLLIKFENPSHYETVRHLKKVCTLQDIKVEEETLKLIVERNGGDVRSALNDLQALAEGRKSLSYQDVSWLTERDRKTDIFNVLRTIFNSKNCTDAKRTIDRTNVDPDMLFEWIYENAPLQLRNPHDLAEAMEALAMADLYRARIRSTQNWTLLKYVYDFMTAGVTMARNRTSPRWIPFRFPERIKMLSKTKGERKMRASIGMKIRKKCHISSLRAEKEILPYLRVIFENNPKMASGLAKWFTLDEAMVEHIAGKKQR